MPTPDLEGSTTQGVILPTQAADRPSAPAGDRSAVDHWQRRLDRARATMQPRRHED